MALSLWLSRDHYDLRDPWEHIDFQVVAAYDVVGAPGWRNVADPQAFAEMWLVREGTVEIRLGDRVAVATAGSAVLLFPGVFRDTRETEGQRLSILGASFQATVLGGLDFLTLLRPPLVFRFETGAFSQFLARLVEESRQRRHGYSLAVHGLGQLALLELLRAHEAVSEEADTVSNVREKLEAARAPELAAALTYVTQHFDSGIDVSRLAKLTHLSPKHFGRKFHAALGMPPMEYVRRVRLSRAREMLTTSEFAAGEIAGRCGFEDAAHFSRAFKRQYGLSPVQYRHEVRNRSLQSKNAPLESNNPGN